jgi:threonine synthase
MKYVSTRGGIEPVEFKAAVMMGLADDGGLIVPTSVPDVGAELESWRALDYPQLAGAVMRPFVSDISEGDLAALIKRSYADVFPPEVVPVVSLGEFFVAELFHGPTLAFKDIALQLLGNIFEHILAETGETLKVLAATSGDTGSAAISGVRGRERIDIYVMHPHGRVSAIQERQMTTVLDANVHNIAVEGTFDDAQRILKEICSDLEFKREHTLGAVNSVNWARVLAQMVYYFHAAFRVQEKTGADTVRFCVPTGNFGDILAGYYAKRMGAPIEQLILATNDNDILARFFNTGVYARGEVAQTLAPAMDIQVASNFERYLYHHLGDDPARVRELMSGFAESGRLSLPLPAGAERFDPLFLAATGTREDTLAAIRWAYEQHSYVMDPHSAVGLHVARSAPGSASALPTACLATAHPAKFPDAVREATGRDDLGRHPTIDALAGLQTRCEVLPAEKRAVQEFMAQGSRA